MNYYWGSTIDKNREGIGDVLVKFPAIDYYTLDLNEKVYFDFAFWSIT